MTLQPEQEDINRKGEQLYEQYAQPLEAEHRGKFIAVSPEGQTLLGDTMLDVAKRAQAQFGHGNFVFKLGPRSVGKWR